ncbi:hypothetical protein [Streptomyces sp. NPDC047928]|uniref:hypothetical protein n=1 Tax=unclassified Streptomyces TaxID=2593676 RepID=UPI00370FCE53
MLKTTALPNVPRWAVLAAHTVPLAALPSGLWRIALAFGAPVGGEPVDAGYAVALSVIAECLALLTLGLVRDWGQVVPRWVPLLGGRPVRPLAAVVPALLGAVGLTALCGWSFLAVYAGLGDLSVGTPLQDLLFHVCYAPLLAWPPLLAAVTLAYWRRRRPALAPPAHG